MHPNNALPLTDRPAGLLTGTAAALLALLAATGCSPDRTPPAPAEPEPRPVRVVDVRESDGEARLRLPAAVRARRRADLAFLADGYLAERDTVPGQRVRRGDALALLYNPALQPEVAAAQADVREARTRLQQLETDTRRQAALLERELVSDDALEQTRTRRDAARAALAQAEARLARARARLEDAALRAPFEGRVSRVHAEPGDFVRAGQPVLSLADERTVECEVQVPPHVAAGLAVDRAATIVLSGDGRSIEARIAEVGLAEPGAPVPVVVVPTGEPAGIAPGAPAYVRLKVARDPRPEVPLDAVIDPGTGYGRVFRVVDGQARRVPVLVGRLSAGWVEVDGELAAGDRVVVAGQANLLDGEPVRTLP
jgi:multidrug efflux system membrane fusion protein